MKYEYGVVALAAYFAGATGQLDNVLAGLAVRPLIFSQSDVRPTQIIHRDSTLRRIQVDSIEPAPKIDPVVRGIVIDHVLFGLDGPYTRGLDEIRQRLNGRGVLVAPPHRSNAHDERWSLCYEVRSLAERTFILLWSDPEMGGDVHELQGFTLSRHKPTNAPCVPIPVRTQVTTDNGLHLGMTLPEVQKIMGKPQKISAGMYLLSTPVR